MFKILFIIYVYMFKHVLLHMLYAYINAVAKKRFPANVSWTKSFKQITEVYLHFY